MFDINAIRQDFPILNRKVNGKSLIYFDNAATSQTPQQVIDVIVDYYSSYNANIHRGVHALSQEATDAYEQSRIKIQKHFNAAKAYEIIFTSGTTHGINLVANGFSSILTKGDEIIVSALEHHSNIVPWQMLCEKTGAALKVIPMDMNGELVLSEFEKLLNQNTKLVFVNHVSNALGTINPIETIIEKAHDVGAAVLVDGAQAAPHIKADVQALDVDFYVCSAHKICGPTGVGALYGKEESWFTKTNLVFWLRSFSNSESTNSPFISIGITLRAAPVIKADVQALDVDFYVCSAHKICGPTGVGALYGKEEWLTKLPPYQGGGEMIAEVTFEKTTYADLPHKFEAGTPNISGGIAFGAALDYMNSIGFETIANYENELLQYATEQLLQIEGVTIYGTSKHKTSVISFNVGNIHPYDIGTILDKMGIAVRTGHHCAQPIMDFYKIPGTIRASFMFYNTKEEIDTFIASLKKAVMMLS